VSDVSQGLCFEGSIEACGRDVMGGSKLAPLRAELLRAMGRPLAPTSLLLLPRALPALAFRFRAPLASEPTISCVTEETYPWLSRHPLEGGGQPPYKSSLDRTATL